MRVTLYTSEAGWQRMLYNAGFMGVTKKTFYFNIEFTVDVKDVEQSKDDTEMYWIEKSDSVKYQTN